MWGAAEHNQYWHLVLFSAVARQNACWNQLKYPNSHFLLSVHPATPCVVFLEISPACNAAKICTQTTAKGIDLLGSTSSTAAHMLQHINKYTTVPRKPKIPATPARLTRERTGSASYISQGSKALPSDNTPVPRACAHLFVLEGCAAPGAPSAEVAGSATAFAVP